MSITESILSAGTLAVLISLAQPATSHCQVIRGGEAFEARYNTAFWQQAQAHPVFAENGYKWSLLTEDTSAGMFFKVQGVTGDACSQPIFLGTLEENNRGAIPATWRYVPGGGGSPRTLPGGEVMRSAAIDPNGRLYEWVSLCRGKYFVMTLSMFPNGAEKQKATFRAERDAVLNSLRLGNAADKRTAAYNQNRRRR